MVASTVILETRTLPYLLRRSILGHLRRFDRPPTTSSLPRQADMPSGGLQVSKVPNAEIRKAALLHTDVWLIVAVYGGLSADAVVTSAGQLFITHFRSSACATVAE